MISLEPFTMRAHRLSAALPDRRVVPDGTAHRSPAPARPVHGAGRDLPAARVRARRYVCRADLVGPAALGPTAFMHRESARNNPQAPLPITSSIPRTSRPGVLTGGVEAGALTLLGSWFRGQEPDENRLDIDRPWLDSWSVQGKWQRGPWKAQVSGGILHEPEWFEPYDIPRITASIEFNGTVRSHPARRDARLGREPRDPRPARRISARVGHAGRRARALLRTRGSVGQGSARPGLSGSAGLRVLSSHFTCRGRDGRLPPRRRQQTVGTSRHRRRRDVLPRAGQHDRLLRHLASLVSRVRALSSAAARFDGSSCTEMLLSLGKSTHAGFPSMSLVALSELLGAPVRGATGAVLGRVREIADRAAGPPHPDRVSNRQDSRRRARAPVRGAQVVRAPPSAPTDDGSAWEQYSASDGVLLLKRDLLDQQIIDVHGRKVVRVNDVELDSTPVNSHVILSVVAVDVGARGAIRRLTKGIVPSFTLRALLDRIPPRVIPWAVRRSPRNRPGAPRQAEDRLRRPLEAAPGRHRRHRRGSAARPSAKPSSKPSTKRSPPRRSRSSTRRSRSRSSSRWTPTAPPTSSRKWTPTPRPTCSASCRKIGRAKSSRRWSRRSARKSRSSSSSASTPPPAA